MQNKKRLCIIELNSAGGLIHYAYQLCTALANAGFDVTLITAADYEMANLPHNFQVKKDFYLMENFTLPNKATGKNLFNAAGGRIARFFTRILRGIFLIIAWFRVSAYLLRVKPDLVQFSRIQFRFEAYFIRRLKEGGLTLTQVCHEFEEREGRNGLERIFALFFGSEETIYANFSALFFHAEENRRRFLARFPLIPAERTHLIAHGNQNWLLPLAAQNVSETTLRRKYGLAERDKIVLFFGLLAPSKGIQDLIEAFALARRSCEAKLLIAGYPTKHIDMHALRKRVAELNLSAHVIFDARYINMMEIGPLMRLSTVVVYPYRTSTQSGALQAAYTFGKPVIATNVGGLPEAVEDGRNGFLVAPEDPPALAQKIVTLIQDAELAETMGAYSNLLSRTRFSWEKIAELVAAVYATL
ncbi:MAG: glycosyltransferase family 4 protein [Anaerolineales bacterium]|nr:glycosyltransferase family 4 protein [Anaerolineales bacterium]